MPNMTFQEEGDYIVCYIDNVEVSRAKKAADGTSTAEVIDIINDQIKANPTLSGTEPNLEGLEVSGDKYAVPQGSGEVHLYQHKLYIMAYGNFECYMHPIYLSTDTAITKDNVPDYLIGYNNYNGESNVCCTIANRIEIENHGNTLIVSVTDTVTQIF